MSQGIEPGDDLSRAAGKHVVLYDGVCGFCNAAIRFVLDRDRDDRFVFCPLQSEFAGAALEKYGKDPDDLDTMYLISDFGSGKERLRFRADAALFTMEQLGEARLWSRFLRVVPGCLRDWGYNLVAASRYRLFGKYDSCRIPSGQERRKFIGLPDNG